MSKVTGGHYFISLVLVTLTNKIEIVITLFTSCLPWGLNELMHISLLKWKRQKCILAWFLPMLPSTQSIRKEGVCLFSFSLGKVLEFFFLFFLSFFFYFLSSLGLERILSLQTTFSGFWDTDSEEWWGQWWEKSDRDRGKW